LRAKPAHAAVDILDAESRIVRKEGTILPEDRLQEHVEIPAQVEHAGHSAAGNQVLDTFTPAALTKVPIVRLEHLLALPNLLKQFRREARAWAWSHPREQRPEFRIELQLDLLE
jgi:hypothetical protein